jgi:hypothetical protein
MKETWGTISAIDGERFQLATGAGKEWFTLGLDAVLEDGDLRQLLERRVEVTVHYDDIPDETSHVANRVFPSARPSFLRQT